MQNLKTKNLRNKRYFYIWITIALLLIEVLIALFVHDAFIRPYIGDVLVVILLYTFLRIFIPEGVRFLPLYIFIFAAGVEVLQYFNFVAILGLQDSTFFRILLGSVFDIQDVICYGVGCLLIAIIQNRSKRVSKYD